jgi:hypothetical protein
MIITRRFWLTAGPNGPAATIDVRTDSRIGEMQAQANAKSYFRRKIEREAVFCQKIEVNSTCASYSIGPKCF